MLNDLKKIVTSLMYQIISHQYTCENSQCKIISHQYTPIFSLFLPQLNPYNYIIIPLLFLIEFSVIRQSLRNSFQISFYILILSLSLSVHFKSRLGINKVYMFSFCMTHIQSINKRMLFMVSSITLFPLSMTLPKSLVFNRELC